MKRPIPFPFTAVALSIAPWFSSVVSAAPEQLQLDPLVIHASPLSGTPARMTTPAAVMNADQLVSQGRATLGETIEHMPGVRGSSFGAGASRPVIRGMDGARVKVLSDGIDVLDASTLSADHAVTTEPLLLQQIEVLKGPATLLYGGGAVGGVVNLVDRKIPTQLPEQGHEVQLGWQGNTVAKESTFMAGTTLGLGSLALRAEGLKRNADAYRLAGHEDGSRSRRQTGSYNDTDIASLGMSWISDTGYTGLAYTRQANVYGLLAHEHGHCHTHGHGASLHWHCGSHGHGHGHDHGDDHDHGIPYIDMLQKRWDFRSEYSDPLAGFSHFKLRVGHSDYQHEEIEGGSVGTRFDSRSTDARLELTHEPLWGWRGVLGGQSLRRDFKAAGEEAYVPRTLTRNHALFVLEEYQQDDWRYELGLRHEWQDIDVKSGQKDRSHYGTSVSLGTVWQFRPDYQLTASVSRSQRLPVAEELYAFGPHAASRTIEVGNDRLKKETSHNLDLGIAKTLGQVTFDLSVFQNRINDYIHAADTGERPGSDYRVIEYRQQDAVFRGAEAQVNYHFSDRLTAGVYGDHVRGKLRNGKGNVARIPADRLGLRVQHAFTDQLDGSLNLFRVMRQAHIADHETKTTGYNMLNASLTYTGQHQATGYTLYLRGDNLLNVKAREHTSFIKDQVQLPGRNLTAGVRVSF